MMIDKRLVNAVPHVKKYVFATVLVRTCALFANIVLIFAVAHIVRTRGNRWQIPALVIVLSLAVRIACDIAASYASYRASSGVKRTLRCRIYQKLLRLGTGYQEQTTTAKVVQLAVEGVEQLETWFSSFLPQFYYSVIAAVATFVVLAFLNMRMALILLACVPLIPISMMIVQRIAKRLLGKYWAQYASLAGNFLENLQGLTTLQIYKADEYKARQMAQEAERFRTVTMKVLSMQLNSIIVMDIVAFGGAGLGIAVALASFYAAALSLDHAFICILLSADFFIPLRALGSAFHTAMNGITASKNIFALLDTKERECGTLAVPALQHGVPIYKAHKLGYQFDRVVLHDCTIEIAEGSYAAFVGKSGSGKSTAAKVLAGICASYSGSVRVNGVELADIAPSSLYEYTTYISHRDWIFAGTVRDCLCEGNANARDDELWHALESVRLASFLRERDGLDTHIQEGGANFSGGQKQRLSIARALLRNSSVYIFDEATSNIDVESEQAILALLHELKGKKTIIMISHRAENCAGADVVYYFENGAVRKETAATVCRVESERARGKTCTATVESVRIRGEMCDALASRTTHLAGGAQ
ncbi:MAG: ABC transporter ATP-binding protein/permease [Treponema sp.]|nr:ABC transporter ATP-binding protein/permease [Treponema sp.]